ncbi:MAG: hypothetical protein ACOY81_09295 [Bacillota bacterium]
MENYTGSVKKVVNAGLVAAGILLILILSMLLIPWSFQAHLRLQGMETELVLRLPGGFRKKIAFFRPVKTPCSPDTGPRWRELLKSYQAGRQPWPTSLPRIFIKELHINCALGLVHNPDLTGWLYALYCSNSNIIKQFLCSRPSLANSRLTLSFCPVFTRDCFALQASCIFKASLANIIRTGWQWRRVVATWRTLGKRGKQSVRTSHRELDENSYGKYQADD